jgi:hypothetical protein
VTALVRQFFNAFSTHELLSGFDALAVPAFPTCTVQAEILKILFKKPPIPV